MHAGQHVVLSLPSAPGKLPHPRLQAENREERISGVDFAALISFEQSNRAFARKESGGVKSAGSRELAEALPIQSVQELTKR